MQGFPEGLTVTGYHRVKPQDKFYSKYGPKLMKYFPQFSDKKLYMVVKDQLHKFDLDELHAFKRERMIHPSPS